jgi:hypothetical protein
MIQMMDGIRAGRCMDGESLDAQPGGLVHVYPCTKRWHQFLSFGNGKEVPKGSIHTTVPLHTRRRIAETGREQEAYMCLGVRGRGDLDEEDWLGEREEEEAYEESSHEEDPLDQIDEDSFSVDGDDMDEEEHDGGRAPLSDWAGEQLIATRCSNVGAVIEWVLVPYIVEEEEEQGVDSLDNGTAEDEEL